MTLMTQENEVLLNCRRSQAQELMEPVVSGGVDAASSPRQISPANSKELFDSANHGSKKQRQNLPVRGISLFTKSVHPRSSVLAKKSVSRTIPAF